VTAKYVGRPDFVLMNKELTVEVVDELGRVGKEQAVLAEAPPGAGKSTLTVSVARALTQHDKGLRLPVVTQTNEQADDLVLSLAQRYPDLVVARLVAGSGPSAAIAAAGGNVLIGNQSDASAMQPARVVIGTARKWQYERSRFQKNNTGHKFQFALIDEAYQMRSDMLLGIADLYETLFCIGDPGQLDPFAVVDDSLWKGLAYSPSRTAMGTLRQFHPKLIPIQLPVSWRLPESASGIVSDAFYPFGGFSAGTTSGDRSFNLGKIGTKSPAGTIDADAVLSRAAKSGWAYVELPESFTVRTDLEIAEALAQAVVRLLARGATVVDELSKSGKMLDASRIAVVTAHNDQVHAVRYALAKAGQDPDQLVVSTANKIQGREYDVVLVWHPLAGRRDATVFHLEAGRMCVMLSRHRHACIVVGRAGADRLLEEFPDSDPIFLDEPEKFPDGWEANHKVLKHLEKHQV
jgi:hypothetical protein